MLDVQSGNRWGWPLEVSGIELGNDNQRLVDEAHDLIQALN